MDLRKRDNFDAPERADNRLEAKVLDSMTGRLRLSARVPEWLKERLNLQRGEYVFVTVKKKG